MSYMETKLCWWDHRFHVYLLFKRYIFFMSVDIQTSNIDLSWSLLNFISKSFVEGMDYKTQRPTKAPHWRGAWMEVCDTPLHFENISFSHVHAYLLCGIVNLPYGSFFSTINTSINLWDYQHTNEFAKDNNLWSRASRDHMNPSPDPRLQRNSSDARPRLWKICQSILLQVFIIHIMPCYKNMCSGEICNKNVLFSEHHAQAANAWISSELKYIWQRRKTHQTVPTHASIARTKN